MSVDARTCAGRTYLGVYVVGKVEHCGTLGELVQVTLGSEHKDLVLV